VEQLGGNMGTEEHYLAVSRNSNAGLAFGGFTTSPQLIQMQQKNIQDTLGQLVEI
jgi:hypothetical protein